jgi:hypothetical protein
VVRSEGNFTDDGGLDGGARQAGRSFGAGSEGSSGPELEGS